MFGALELCAEGERQFGGEVLFEVEPTDPEWALVETMASLHACARPAGECDCCPECLGEGTLPTDEARIPCWACAGMGYVARELR